MARPIERAFVALGGNLGNREQNFAHSLGALSSWPELRVVGGSAVYQTPPVGPGRQEDYWNAVVELETTLAPEELLSVCLATENGLGRVREERWGPRIIDLDILLYGDQVIVQLGLEVPHPLLHERAFVLRPLADLAPERVVRGKTISEWLAEVSEEGMTRVRDSVLQCR